MNIPKTYAIRGGHYIVSELGPTQMTLIFSRGVTTIV